MVKLNDYRVRAVMKALEDERKLRLLYTIAVNLPGGGDDEDSAE